VSHTDRIFDFIVDELLLDPDDEELTLDDELLMSERIDSLGLMRLIAFIDEEFGVKVPYADILIENFRDTRTIGNYLSDRLATAQ
jgi:acyl carrier protein